MNEIVIQNKMYEAYNITQELEHRYQSELIEPVLAVFNRVPNRTVLKRELKALEVNKHAIEYMIDSADDIHTMHKTELFYSIDGIDDGDIQRVRFNKETGIGTAEIREVSYTYDYDIDQEVHQGYSDERGDYEYVKNIVTDTYEEEHVHEYDVYVHLVNDEVKA